MRALKEEEMDQDVLLKKKYKHLIEDNVKDGKSSKRKDYYFFIEFSFIYQVKFTFTKLYFEAMTAPKRMYFVTVSRNVCGAVTLIVLIVLIDFSTCALCIAKKMIFFLSR